MRTPLPFSTRGLVRLGLAFLIASTCWARPSESGLDLQNLDPSTPPHVDFFQYANGGWLKANKIPDDKPRWGTFNQLHENNQERLHQILQECAQPASPTRDANSRKLGDFYQSGMDPESLRAGLATVRSGLEAIAQIQDRTSLQREVVGLHLQGVRPYFGFSSGQDYRESRKVTGHLTQGGLGLPDRDYYFRSDEASEKQRTRYLKFIRDSFVKLGDPVPLAEEKARHVFELETELARHSLTLVEQRNPETTYHPVTLTQLKEQAPGWDWERYFEQMGAPRDPALNLAAPKFFLGLGELLDRLPLEQHRHYLQWQWLRKSMEHLSEDWAELHFEFYGRTLTGAKAMSDRWRRVVKTVDSNMGDALGKKYVARHFPPEAKNKVDEMVVQLRAALDKTLQDQDWMSPQTRSAARAKLSSFRAKIGYPDSWRDDSALEIRPGNFLENILRAQRFEVSLDLQRIGRPWDPDHWYMSAPTVNAYYDPQNNEIVFPAGILQPPFFSLETDEAVNYGGLGMVIGHEITHGFDDQGAQFDAQGNLRNWWSEEDLKRFQQLAKAIEDQFSAYQVADGLHINGPLVVGESIADLGGLKLAWMAYHDSQAGKEARLLDGFTPQQRFFLGYARIWAMNMRPEYERLQVNTDPHPHPRFRVNGPLSNLEEFQKTFSCPPDSPMVRKQRNRVW